MRWRLERATARRALLASAALLTLQTVIFTLCYATAWQYLRAHDPRRVENLRGISYYARPKLLSGRLALTREQLAAYLAALGYQQCAGEAPGTFSLAGNALRVNARLPEFPSATIYFQEGRIQAIEVGGQFAAQIALEPPPLGNVIQQLKDGRLRKMHARRVVLAEDKAMSSHLYPTTVCAEDRRFATHNGIDELGIIAALVKRGKGGGSGLVQQLIKNAVLGDVSSGWSPRGLMRKAKEFFLALAACRLLTKRELFTAYANHCPLGGGEEPGTLVLYGFGAASQELFGVEVDALTLGQAAALSALLPRPNYFLRAARRGDYDELRQRRALILDAVARQFADRYTPEQIAQAKAEPLAFLFVSEHALEQPLDLISRHFQSFAAAQAHEHSDLNFNQALSTRVYLTLDPELQAAASVAVRRHLQRLDPLVAAARRRQKLPAEQTEQLQAALVAMDVQTGEILALVGSRGTEEFNYADAPRSPGSAIKPFVYLAALSDGQLHGAPFTAATIIDPLRDPVDDYRPHNHPGERASARRNLAISGNAASCVVAHSAGLGRVRDHIARFTGARAEGLTGMLAIGGSAGTEVSVINLTTGYAALANGGLQLTPTALTAIHQSGQGEPTSWIDDPVALSHPAPARLADAAPVYVLTQMLRSAVQPGGTGARALSLAGLSNSAPIAAKTGTGQVADLWFCGYSPRFAACIWIGMPKNQLALRLADGFDGAHAALPIWAAFVSEGVRRYRPELLAGEFVRPAQVQVLRVDERRGCRPAGEHGRLEFFVAGRVAPPCMDETTALSR